jgi:hypothetical protein
MKPADDARRRRRRRFAAQWAPLAIILIVLGAVPGSHEGVVGVVGLVALAQGIGLAVASIWLAVGHNPVEPK